MDRISNYGTLIGILGSFRLPTLALMAAVGLGLPLLRWKGPGWLRAPSFPWFTLLMFCPLGFYGVGGLILSTVYRFPMTLWEQYLIP